MPISSLNYPGVREAAEACGIPEEELPTFEESDGPPREESEGGSELPSEE